MLIDFECWEFRKLFLHEVEKAGNSPLKIKSHPVMALKLTLILDIPLSFQLQIYQLHKVLGKSAHYDTP